MVGKWLGFTVVLEAWWLESLQLHISTEEIFHCQQVLESKRAVVRSHWFIPGLFIEIKYHLLVMALQLLKCITITLSHPKWFWECTLKQILSPLMHFSHLYAHMIRLTVASAKHGFLPPPNDLTQIQVISGALYITRALAALLGISPTANYHSMMIPPMWWKTSSLRTASPWFPLSSSPWASQANCRNKHFGLLT